MKKLTLRELKQHLKDKSHAELINDIAALFTRFDAVKEYYGLQLQGSYSQELLDKYKAVVRHEFFPARGHGNARLSIARRAITDYKKVSDSAEGLIDLMLFYVEMGVQFTNTYGDINEAFYNSMESVYDQATKLIAKHNLRDQFERRCQTIVKNSRSTGWGFHDTLSEIYDEIFESEPPDDV